MRKDDLSQTCKEVLSTDKGLTLLAMLKTLYVDTTSLQHTEHATFYALGQKELVQELLNYVDQPVRVREINNRLYYEDGIQ